MYHSFYNVNRMFYALSNDGTADDPEWPLPPQITPSYILCLFRISRMTEATVFKFYI